MKIGVYVHIPFCRKKCDYCNFYSIPTVCHEKEEKEALIERYISRLLKEIEDRSPGFSDFGVDTIYLGGGTPSLLHPRHLKRILERIRDSFNTDKKSEITIECNPEDFSIERIQEYVSFGINRVVLGMQTRSSRLHSVIGRSSQICDEKMLSDFFSIDDIVHCIDIMTGIPGQTEEELSGDISIIDRYRFEHISAYILSIEHGTPLTGKVVCNSELENIQRGLFEVVINFFKEKGYSHYEVSNFALPSFESKHNLKYWQFSPYIGFGPGAHSFYGGERFYNPSSVEEYILSSSPLARDERTKRSEIIEYLLTCMRLLKGISLKDFESKVGASVPEELLDRFQKMKSNGHLEIEEREDDTSIRFTPEGFFIMDSLIYEMADTVL